jgi:hypothetical protein
VWRTIRSIIVNWRVRGIALLTEYLYIDHRRLDSYIEQLGPPVVYDKVPVWSAELSITGPKASGSQNRPARPMTDHEKIQSLVKHLEEIPPAQRSGALVLESCMARRILIPSGTKASADFAIWLNLETSKDRGGLCLVEDARPGDSPSSAVPYSTAYTLLTALFGHMRDGFKNVIMGLDAKHVEETGEHPMRWFSNNPIGVLRMYGCLIPEERRICTLYRKRERVKNGNFIVGYPIYIAEAESEEISS